MTEQSWTLLGVAAIAALPPTLAQLFARRAQKKEAVVIEAKVDAVHAIADGRLTATQAKLEAVEALVTREHSAETIREAVALAVAAAFKKNGEKLKGG